MRDLWRAALLFGILGVYVSALVQYEIHTTHGGQNKEYASTKKCFADDYDPRVKVHSQLKHLLLSGKSGVKKLKGGWRYSNPHAAQRAAEQWRSRIPGYVCIETSDSGLEYIISITPGREA